MNNEEEASYCLDKIIKILESAGLKTSVKQFGNGLFASMKKDKGYFISYSFSR